MDTQTKIILTVASVATLGLAGWFLSRPSPKKKTAKSSTNGGVSSPSPMTIPAFVVIPMWNESFRPRAIELAESEFKSLGSPAFSWDTVAKIAASVSKSLYPNASIVWPTTSAASDSFLVGRRPGWIPWGKIFDISMKAMGYDPEYGPGSPASAQG